MRLDEVVQTFAAVSATRSRLEKVERLAACLRAAGPDWGPVVVAWLSGELRQGKIGVGPAALRRVRETEPAAKPTLSLAEVEEAFAAMGAVSGRGTRAERERLLEDLFGRASAEEQRFLARLLVGELRQGALEGVMIEAIAEAWGLPAAAVRRASMLSGSLPRVAETALREGAAGLERFALTLFRPVRPMLASPADSVEAALERLGGRAVFEQKLDGARIQVHREKDRVRVYTRALRDVSAAVPDVVEAVAALPLRDAILDGETLALRSDGTPHPFQVTMTRFGRRRDVEALRADLPLHAFFFDALRLDGRELIDAPTGERHAALDAALPETLRVERRVVEDRSAGEAFFEAALEAGHEGVMVKSLEAAYRAGARGAEWLKLKPAHDLDLVVLAAEWGSGRRRGWLSNLHLGARDESRGGFTMLGKTFKGLSDELLSWQTRELLAREERREEGVVYVRPELVVEIAVGDVQTSPHYPAGLALRFARVRRYRPDKSPEETDTVEAVRALRRS